MKCSTSKGMKTTLKQLYVTQTKQKNFPYGNQSSALRRLWTIFKTANLGRFNRSPFFPAPANVNAMSTVWQVLSPIVANPSCLPSSQNAFDAWHQQVVVDLAHAYHPQAPFPLGVAQKTLNLVLKDLWAWNMLTEPQEDNLHAPIDRIIYQKYLNPPARWQSWSLVQWTNESELTALWQDYQILQTGMRQRAQLLTSSNLVIQPLMLEQLLWGGI